MKSSFLFLTKRKTGILVDFKSKNKTETTTIADTILRICIISAERWRQAITRYTIIKALRILNKSPTLFITRYLLS